MPEPKAGEQKVRGTSPAPRRAAKKTVRKHPGTDAEAFYAAQQEAAADSRDYAARRRQRRV